MAGPRSNGESSQGSPERSIQHTSVSAALVTPPGSPWPPRSPAGIQVSAPTPTDNNAVGNNRSSAGKAPQHEACSESSGSGESDGYHSDDIATASTRRPVTGMLRPVTTPHMRSMRNQHLMSTATWQVLNRAGCFSMDGQPLASRRGHGRRARRDPYAPRAPSCWRRARPDAGTERRVTRSMTRRLSPNVD